MSRAHAAAPAAITSAATSIATSSATLNGTGNPSGEPASGWFRYSLVDPGGCNDIFGIRAPASGGSALGSGASFVPFSQAISGLSPGTTYYFCAIVSNPSGTAFGTVLSFLAGPPPTVTTSAATSVSSVSATLNGSGNPNGSATTAWFRFSTVDPGTCNDTFGSRAPPSGGSSLGSGTSTVAFSQTISSLSPTATYYFCAIAASANGTGFGTVLSFVAGQPPTVTTLPATSVTSSGATLNGSGTPNGDSTTAWFRYSTVDPGSCNDVFGSRAPASGGWLLGVGSVPVAFSQGVGPLSAATTYHFCAIAQSISGTAFGSLLSFATPAAAPTVATAGATNVTCSSAALNGTAIPGGDAAIGWFRLGTVHPGACNDSFGSRVPPSGGTALGAGGTPVPFSAGQSGLLSLTRYYTCALAANGIGTAFGTIDSFLTCLTLFTDTFEIGDLSRWSGRSP